MNNRQAANVLSGAFRREYERRCPPGTPSLNAGVAAAAMQRLLDTEMIRPVVNGPEVEEITGRIEVPAPPTQRGWGSGWRSAY